MPIKLRASAITYDRFTKKYTTTYYHVKSLSQKELFEELNKHNTKPKVRQKIRTELIRRGIKIVKRAKTNE